MAKNLLLWLVSLGALCGQDIVGTWQGSMTLLSGEVVRAVMKVDRDNGSLFATLYPNIDGNPRPIPATSAALQGSTLSITFVPGGDGLRR